MCVLPGHPFQDSASNNYRSGEKSRSIRRKAFEFANITNSRSINGTTDAIVKQFFPDGEKVKAEDYWHSASIEGRLGIPQRGLSAFQDPLQ